MKRIDIFKQELTTEDVIIEAEAIKEAEAMIKYHTTGIDAVSREYAIEMIVEDIECGW